MPLLPCPAPQAYDPLRPIRGAFEAMAQQNRKLRKKKRETLVSLFFFLPFRYRLVLDNWLRGRKEFKEIRKADVVIVSPPKCGRTWVRVLLSRFFQIAHGLPDHQLLGFDNYHRMCPAVPKIRFTHDRYVSDYTRERDTKRTFYDKKVILLVRDPRDVVVSNYFQWIITINPFKRKARRVPDDPKSVPLYDFFFDQDLGVHKTIRFLNAWESELPKTKTFLIVRYEDLKADTEEALKRMLSFMALPHSEDQVRAAVDYASFENMRALEKSSAFDSGSRRLAAKDSDDASALKVRRGKIGGYRDYLSKEEIAQIDGLLEAQLSPLYGYTRRSQDLPAA